MDYEKLLEKGLKNLPESTQKSERFEIPKVKGHIQGNKTIITNFQQIAKALHREPEHLLKFLLRELATPGQIDKQRLTFNRKIKSAQINQKIDQYTKLFVLCHECKKPDTQLVKEGRISSIKCMACGAKHPIRAKI